MLLASLIIVATVFAINEPKRQADQSADHGSNTEQSGGSTPKTFWQKTEEDPTAYFTMWLVIFTGVLSTVSIVQIGFLIRSDVTARRSADAALLAAQAAGRQADAAIGVEIPRLIFKRVDFVISRENVSNMALKIRDMRFEAEFVNLGRTAAFLERVSGRACVGTEIPDTMDDGVTYHPPSNMVIEAEKSYMFEFTGPVNVPLKEITEILEDRSYLYVYGFVEYRDFLSNLHRTPFWRHLMYWGGLNHDFVEIEQAPEEYSKRW
jgi:hypothetical protein